jgi:hypothetical protein
MMQFPVAKGTYKKSFDAPDRGGVQAIRIIMKDKMTNYHVFTIR